MNAHAAVQLPMPHSIEAEQALLGAILINNDAFGMVASTLAPDHFKEPAHAEIFRLCGSLIAAGRKVTPITLKDALPDIEIAGMPMPRYIARLAAEATTVINAPDYALHIRDLAISRAIIALADDLRAAASNAVAPVEALAAAWDALDALRGQVRDDSSERASAAEAAGRLLQDEHALVIPTGLADLDRAIAGGLRSKRMVIIGARPSMGKTALLCSIARRIGNQGYGTSIFSLETDEREMMARLTSDEIARTGTPVPYRDIIANNLEQTLKERVRIGAQRIGKLPIRLDVSGGLSMAEIEARARMDRDRFQRAGIRYGAVFIDYLGLIRHTDRYRGRKVDEIGELSWAAKTMAKRLDVCVVMLSQLNRAVEHRDDKAPNMSDLRDSGNVEQDADIIGLLYRPAYYIERSAEFRANSLAAIEAADRARHQLDFIVAKNKLGPTPTVHLWCDMAHSAVDNAARY